MAWQGLHLSQKAHLSLADGQLVVALEGNTVRRPLEDLAWIILDTPMVTLTSALLSACMNAGIAMLVTDQRHIPSGMLLPFHTHFRQAGVGQSQLSASTPLKKRLWQMITERKILNQASALKIVGGIEAATLAEMARHVGSGDPGNVEARAARYYWERFFINFRREDESDRRNACLNYGYAVVRGAVARALVAVGLLPSIGVMHSGVTNAFNLADDLMEPFRPFVDIMAHRLNNAMSEHTDPLTLDDRRALAGACLVDVKMGDEHVTLLVATEKTATSLVAAFENNSAHMLVLPELI